MKKLPELDFETRSPRFSVKRPKGKSDEEILTEVEKKVIQMLGNYTHKEWECAQKILKHQGRVSRVLEEMGVSCPLRLWPSIAGKKMQLPCNIGFEFVETSKKGKSCKAATVAEGTSKSAKAKDVLAKLKAEAAKTTLLVVFVKPTGIL
jgi:hypothetical protein